MDKNMKALACFLNKAHSPSEAKSLGVGIVLRGHSR